MSSKANTSMKNRFLQQVENPMISEEERERMIAEAAYFNAEHRGFMPGDPKQDWLLAEKQIDQQLHS